MRHQAQELRYFHSQALLIPRKSNSNSPDVLLGYPIRHNVLDTLLNFLVAQPLRFHRSLDHCAFAGHFERSKHKLTHTKRKFVWAS
ncbi:hypothetical protein C7399_14011 [Paraburkholderia tropica]|uniref:Uncharacterized protein n=1 Tax=Paraburkholderia tropica TaxID=92647 RepID=A0AAQ1GMS2_9BURK|nr:hypothetical protein C7400_14011 [Paraburkholderia tropica]PZW70760.1 hypothetical protein C7399_14011 [Paraburkholderia tropica]SEK12911.1 hypothetical protein SAMN05216550_12319 [Paraburkholderia tropica]